jgi:hypothetical protein
LSINALLGSRGASHQKTTLCHATGSATNPYVLIRVSDRAIQAHARHQHEEDIIPASSEADCPPGAQGGPPGDVNFGGGGGGGNEPPNPEKITICHATGSETNPFVLITISVNGLNGHADHQDGEDIIPATSLADCPVTAAGGPPGGEAPQEGGFGPEGAGPPEAGDVRGGQQVGDVEAPGEGEEAGPEGAVEGVGSAGGPEESGVLGVSGESGDGAPADEDVVEGEAAGGDLAADTDEDGALAFTGLDLVALGLVGLVLGFAGGTIRRLMRRQPARG